MATLTTIINSAFRESGITAVGATPSSTEAAEALTVLINLITSVYTDEVGEILEPFDVGTSGITYPADSDHTVDTVIPINSALQCNLTSALTLYMPAIPKSGDIISITDVAGNFATRNLTLNGNGRKINGSTSPTVLNTNSVSIAYIYLQNIGWQPITTLTSGSDTCPFDSKYDDMFAIMLALRLNPRYGATTAPETMKMYQRLYKQFKNQYRSTREVGSETGLISLPSNRLNKTSTFTRGS